MDKTTYGIVTLVAQVWTPRDLFYGDADLFFNLDGMRISGTEVDITKADTVIIDDEEENPVWTVNKPFVTVEVENGSFLFWQEGVADYRLDLFESTPKFVSDWIKGNAALSVSLDSDDPDTHNEFRSPFIARLTYSEYSSLDYGTDYDVEFVLLKQLDEAAFESWLAEQAGA